ncbi:MAG: insulinase family protein [Polyangiaceae bacterium]|nr:insulinase family protein [Polyangiaceae bacterium]
MKLVERSFRLQNGLAVELVAGPCGEAAAVAVLLTVGTDHDPPGRSGMVHLVERLLATSAGAGRAERTVVSGSDHILYSLGTESDRLGDELDDVAAWMSVAIPTEGDFERVRAQLVGEVGALAGRDAPATALVLAEEAAQPSPGDGRRRGIAAELQAITFRELQSFWLAHLRPGNARIASAGRFDADRLRAHIENAFGSLPGGAPPIARPPADATVRGTLVMGESPTAVAMAVPAPPRDGPLYPPFLVLAARLLNAPAQGRTWQAQYDPMERPELLSITGLVGQAEQPEPAAARIRADVAALLARPLGTEEPVKTRQRFRLLVEPELLDPGLCAEDPRAFALAKVRRAQLQLASPALAQALDATKAADLVEAAKLFDAKHTATVIAGGAIR